MGLWDVLRGQSKPRKANLDALFAVPSAAMTLEASLGLHPVDELHELPRALEIAEKLLAIGDDSRETLLKNRQ